jgi:Family of unknown function (DUF5895)
MSKSKSSESTEITIASSTKPALPDPAISDVLKEFASSEYDDDSRAVEFPTLTFLNNQSGGLFIKQSQMNLSGWIGDPPNYTHTYSDGKTEEGYLTHEPRMLVLYESDRIVEIRGGLPDKGVFIDDILRKHPHLAALLPCVEDDFFPSYMSLGFYSSSEGERIHKALGKTFTTLRTNWIVYLLDENSEKLHSMPFRLTLKGYAAASFGVALKQFQMQLKLAAGEVTRKSFFNKGWEFLSLGIFCPVLEASMQGETQKNFVTCVIGFKQVTKESLHSLFAGHLKESIQPMLKNLAEAISPFVHTASTKELPPAMPEELRSAQIDEDE